MNSVMKLLLFFAPSAFCFLVVILMSFAQPDDSQIPVSIGVEGWLLIITGAAIGALIQGGYVLWRWNINGQRERAKP